MLVSLSLCVYSEYQAGADSDETILRSIPPHQAAVAVFYDRNSHYDHCEQTLRAETKKINKWVDL